MRRRILLAASPTLTFLAASLGWALADRIRYHRCQLWNP
jgi:hypothetical protein